MLVEDPAGALRSDGGESNGTDVGAVRTMKRKKKLKKREEEDEEDGKRVGSGRPKTDSNEAVRGWVNGLPSHAIDDRSDMIRYRR